MRVSFLVDQDLAERMFRAAYGRTQHPVIEHVLVASVWFLIAAAAFWHSVGFKTNLLPLGSSVVVGLFFAVFGYFRSLSEPNIKGKRAAEKLFASTKPFEASFCLSDKALVVRDNLMTMHLPWKVISGVHRIEDWLIFDYGPGSSFLVPVTAFSSHGELDAFEARALVLHKQHQHSSNEPVPTDSVA